MNKINKNEWVQESTGTVIQYTNEKPYDVKFVIITNQNIMSGSLVAIPGNNFEVEFNATEININASKFKVGLDKVNCSLNPIVEQYMKSGGVEQVTIEYSGEERGLGGEITHYDDVTRHTFTSSGLYTP
jgi:hypothetical protein